MLLEQGEQEIATGVGHDLDDVLAEADLVLTDSTRPRNVARDQ